MNSFSVGSDTFMFAVSMATAMRSLILAGAAPWTQVVVPKQRPRTGNYGKGRENEKPVTPL